MAIVVVEAPFLIKMSPAYGPRRRRGLRQRIRINQLRLRAGLIEQIVVLGLGGLEEVFGLKDQVRGRRGRLELMDWGRRRGTR